MPLTRPALPGRFHAESLFRPDSVAVVGAGSELGMRAMHNMLEAGFQGAVLPVDPSQASIMGVLAYPDIASLPIAPDLAVVTSGTAELPGVLYALAARGTYAAVALGPADGVLAAALASGVRVLGPGSIGIAVPRLGLNASTLHLQPQAGRIALVSQSATLCRAVLDWAGPNGVGFSHIVGMGGLDDIEFDLVLDWLSRDADTGAILLDIRGIRQSRTFLSAARAASRLRPVVAIHAGGLLQDPTGREDAVLDAALRRSGIVRVARLSDFLAAAETLTRARPARSESLAIVTNAIGPAHMAADAALMLGIRLAELDPETRAVIQLSLPPAPHERGLAYVGTDRPTRLAEAAAMLSAVPNIGGVVVVMAPLGPPDGAAVDSLAACQATTKLPLLVSVLGETTGAPHRRRLAEAGVPVFATPEEAVRGFAQLVQQRRARAAANELPSSRVLQIAPDRARVRGLLDAIRGEGRLGLRQDEAMAVLAAYGLPIVPCRWAMNEDDAAAAAEALGFPAVLKLRRPSMTALRAPGSVVLDLADAAAVRHAVRSLRMHLARLPQATDEGFLVQKQVGRARELRLRVSEDRVFGPAIGVGQGGGAADLLGDMAIDLPPLNLTLAHSLVARSPTARSLTDSSDQPAADLDAVADALVRISQLIVDFREILSLDVNPLFADADGVRVADAWMALRPAGGSSRLAITPYPAEWTLDWTSCGQTITIRPIRPEDAEAHAALFHRLSPEDVRYRFFTVLRELSAEQIARMTQVDYSREMAFVAVRENAAGVSETVGVCRLIREPHSTEGEFAILVQRDMRGTGLSQRMMQHLIEWGREQGMTSILGQVLAENATMLAFVRRMGFRITHRPDEPDVIEARLDVEHGQPDATPPPDTRPQ